MPPESLAVRDPCIGMWKDVAAARRVLTYMVVSREESRKERGGEEIQCEEQESRREEEKGSHEPTETYPPAPALAKETLEKGEKGSASEVHNRTSAQNEIPSPKSLISKSTKALGSVAGRQL